MNKDILERYTVAEAMAPETSKKVMRDLMWRDYVRTFSAWQMLLSSIQKYTALAKEAEARTMSVFHERMALNRKCCSVVSCDAVASYFDDAKNGLCEEHAGKIYPNYGK